MRIFYFIHCSCVQFCWINLFLSFPTQNVVGTLSMMLEQPRKSSAYINKSQKKLVFCVFEYLLWALKLVRFFLFVLKKPFTVAIKYVFLSFHYNKFEKSKNLIYSFIAKKAYIHQCEQNRFFSLSLQNEPTFWNFGIF